MYSIHQTSKFQFNKIDSIEPALARIQQNRDKWINKKNNMLESSDGDRHIGRLFGGFEAPESKTYMHTYTSTDSETKSDKIFSMQNRISHTCWIPMNKVYSLEMHVKNYGKWYKLYHILYEMWMKAMGLNTGYVISTAFESMERVTMAKNNQRRGWTQSAQKTGKVRQREKRAKERGEKPRCESECEQDTTKIIPRNTEK